MGNRGYQRLYEWGKRKRDMHTITNRSQHRGGMVWQTKVSNSTIKLTDECTKIQ